jgi:N-acetylglucosamine-6-sulfatase
MTRAASTREAVLLPLAAALLGVSSLALADTPTPPRATHPNIVLLLTDDQRWDTLPYMPAVQRLLVAQGVTFTNSFTTTPLCMPSRTSLLTGQYAHHTGALTNFPPRGGSNLFVGPDASTVATWLHQAGYRTGIYGKYVNLYQFQCPPHTATCYRPPGWDEWHVLLDEATYNYRLTDGSSIVSYGSDPEDYSTDVLAAKAADFVRNTHGQPFLLFVAFHEPHDEGLLPPIPAPRHGGTFANLPPLRPPSWDEADVSDKPAWIRRRPRATDLLGSGVLQFPVGEWSDRKRLGQLQALQAIDEAVERILGAVEASGQTSNTVVIFTSDNGLSWEEHRWIGKGCPYEECLRVPLVIRFPPLARGGRQDARMALNIDLAPTIAALAHVPVAQGTDGQSLVPLLRRSGGPWRPAFLFEYFANPGEVPPNFTGVRTKRWKLTRYDDPSDDELLHLSSDPYELTSAPPHQHAVTRHLQRALDELRGPVSSDVTAGHVGEVR